MNTMNASLSFKAALLLAIMLILPGCANKAPGQPLQVTAQQEDSDNNGDPIEGFNRGLFRVHEVIDGLFLSPMAHIYRGVVPEAGRNGIRNALTNAGSPVVLLNSVLQWDMPNAGRTVERFAINTTVGVVGLFDVASYWGIEKQHAKDFGQTMGVYGVGTGPYLLIPILGPSDTRDAVGFVVDIFTDPLTYIFGTNANYAYEGMQGLVERTDLLPLTDRIHRDSLDPYSTYRSVYLQHRAKVVRDYKRQDSSLQNEK